jgi:subtilase family serine protease
MGGTMQYKRFTFGVLAAALSAALIAPAAHAHAGNGHGHTLPAHAQKKVCGPPKNGVAECHAHVVTQPDGVTPLASATYAYGFAPADLTKAYGIGAGVGTPTVAIVDAFDNPTVESDLAVNRSQFGLPACTTANGCFSKVNQNGGTSYPAGDVGWGQEIALDVEMASAICPNCHILLVEANANGFNDLMTAVDYATAHAQYVSNSYGADEVSGLTAYESHFNKPGVAITVSSGDNGYGVEYPAASQYVTAVGGTHLVLDASGNRSSETVWAGAGSGCSGYIAKPSWQHDTGCAKRTVADVAAVADPSTGVAVYDSYGSSGGNNWYVFGGTSVAAPIIAATYAVAGPPSAGTYASSYPYYNSAASLFDVTSGKNTSGTCSTYLCMGAAGYDGPTGLGTPIGAAAFAPATAPPPPPVNHAPVIDSKSKSCSAATCTFTVNAHDPDGDALTYSWTKSTSTTKTATIKYTTSGSKTVTVTVSDGKLTAKASFSVSCKKQVLQGLVCS